MPPFCLVETAVLLLSENCHQIQLVKYIRVHAGCLPSNVVYGVLDPHRFDTDPDPDLDQTFQFAIFFTVY